MSGSKSRDKGRRAEQEVVRIFKEHDVPAKRISMMETGGIDKGDVEVAGVWEAEVKSGGHVPKWIYDATKRDEHWLICKRDRKKWKLIVDLDWFLEKFL